MDLKLIDELLLNPLNVELKGVNYEIPRLPISKELKVLSLMASNTKESDIELYKIVFDNRYRYDYSFEIKHFLIYQVLSNEIASIYRKEDYKFILTPESDRKGGASDTYLESINEKLGLVKIVFDLLRNFGDLSLINHVNCNTAILFNRLNTIYKNIDKEGDFWHFVNGFAIGNTGDKKLVEKMKYLFGTLQGRSMKVYKSMKAFVDDVTKQLEKDKKDEINEKLKD